jgi:hypothetical protein
MGLLSLGVWARLSGARPSGRKGFPTEGHSGRLRTHAWQADRGDREALTCRLYLLHRHHSALMQSAFIALRRVSAFSLAALVPVAVFLEGSLSGRLYVRST